MGQRIDKSEPYFVHIGFTYVHELRKQKLRTTREMRKGRTGPIWAKLKTTPAKAKRLAKLERYWNWSVQ